MFILTFLPVCVRTPNNKIIREVIFIDRNHIFFRFRLGLKPIKPQSDIFQTGEILPSKQPKHH